MSTSLSIMKATGRSLLPLLLTLLITLSHAIEPAFVELQPPRTKTPWLGERLDLLLNVTVEGRFAGATYIDLPEIPGAILFRGGDRPVLSTRTIDNQEYTVQTHQISLFCQREGTLKLSGIIVRCGSIKQLGETEKEHKLTVPETKVTPRAQPDLIPSQIAITGLDFKVKQKWEPQPGKAKLGDAFKRKVTITAENLPAMLLPPLPKSAPEGLAVYPSAPELNDQSDRGDFLATRTNSITYLCEKAGQFRLPAISFRCWNAKDQEWTVQELPEVVIEVAAAPETQRASSDSRPARWGWILGISVILVSGIAAGLWLRRSHESPEGDAYASLLEACHRDSASEAVSQFHRWLAESPLDQADPPTALALRAAEEAVVFPDRSWSGKDLASCVKALRRSHQPILSKQPPRPPSSQPGQSGHCL